MRHVDNAATNGEIFPIKEEDFDDFVGKVEMPNNIDLDDCEPSIKIELMNGLQFDLDDDAVLGRRFEKKKNKRKSHSPQKNVKQKTESTKSDDQSDDNLGGVIEGFNTDLDVLLKDFDEDNIFRDLGDDEGEENTEMMDNVKEEFKSHWGVKCNMCEKVFRHAEFDKHYVTSYNKKPVYTCAFCNKTVEKYSTFRSHCYRHVTDGRYKCEKCPKAFCLQSLLQVHMVNKHSKVKPYVCCDCGKDFLTQTGMKMHLNKHRADVKEEYPCVVCGKVLHTRGGLTSHMNVHRLGRRFMCDVCGKTFTQKVNMQQHAKQHTGDKPHRCDKCGKTFAEKSHLARHSSFHSDQRPFKCDVCNKMYKTERCLKVHSMVHAEERPFVCTYCNKGFLSSTKLKQHHNVHTGERPFVCKYCSRSFTNYPNWLKHIRRRHKVDHKTGNKLEPDVKDEIKDKQPQMAQEITSNVFQDIQSQQQQQSTSSIESQATLDVVPPNQIDMNINFNDLPQEITADVHLTRTEELFLQQSLLQCPIVDEKYLFQPQTDVYQSNTLGLPVQYVQQPQLNSLVSFPTFAMVNDTMQIYTQSQM